MVSQVYTNPSQTLSISIAQAGERRPPQKVEEVYEGKGI
jgi:hypothetical protein